MANNRQSPFGYDGDDDDEARKADERLLQNMKSEPQDPAADIEEPTVSEPDPETGSLEIDLDEDKPSRLDKKRERYEEMQRERDDHRERLRRLEDENRQMRERLLYSPPSQQPSQQTSDPLKEFDDKIRDARSRQVDKYEAFVAREKPSTEEVRRYREEAFQVEQEIQDLVAQKALARALSKAQASQPSPEAQELLERHRDVIYHPQAKHKAYSVYLDKVANDPTLERRPADAAKAREEAFDLARKAFRLGRYAVGEPDAADHARHGGGGPRGPSRPGNRGTQKIVLNRDQQRMADELFRHVPQNKRYQIYAKHLAKQRAGK